MDSVKTAALTSAQKELRKKLLGSGFKVYTALNVPLGFIAGMKLISLEPTMAQATIPFKFLTKNPFKSIYFAAQSMAAELSTAALVKLALEGITPSIAFIIIGMEAVFTKKATDKVTFTCEDGELVVEAVKKCVETGEAATVRMKTTGRMPDGTEVATFYFTWSLKQRKN
ncbi:MAG: DUF4442 domain-containing protein [Flammeovirgaceae bacterium]|nr:DUF4442 domain-containing protein [Flammeovirgaceae bacterium]MDW8287135.1 DUF4442 domain-containing protein [Flammeovirgaceae bacterium]